MPETLTCPCGDPAHSTHPAHAAQPGRRNWLKKAGAGSGAALAAALGLRAEEAGAASLSRAERDALTPDQILANLQQGNARFRAGKAHKHDYRAQKRASAAGQFPAAVILSCIDSRAPVEIILDAGIGETFNARVAGNACTDELLGSLEFACAAAGAKVVLVMGHTACGAVRGAIDQVELGHLTGLLARIQPAVAATPYAGERTGRNAEFVDAVATTHVRATVEAIRSGSPILAALEKDGKVKMLGAMYNLSDGRMSLLS